jgi:dihydroxyacetone kinase-like predicted kinase
VGRTVPTYRQTLESIVQDLADYRRALTEKDREVFDEMMKKARMHASASTYAAFLDPLEGFLLSVLLEHEKNIKALKDKNEGR